MKLTLLCVLGVVAASYLAFWWSHLRASARELGSPAPTPRVRPTAIQLAIGFVTNFFDTLGIGNFAPTAAVFRFTRMVPDELIPGTMNVGHALPVVLEALVFITIVEVESSTLIPMILAAVAGAWVGTGVVTALPRQGIQTGLGLALAAAAAFMIAGQFDAFPLGGEAVGLDGFALALAIVAVGVLGALMTIGVGLYAPCMVLISLLGMDPKAAFPIMMGACAFLMPVASARFVERKRYAPQPAIGLALGGLPGVAIAAFVVKALPLSTMRWLVVAVVTYTSIVMLRAARSGRDGASA